MFRKLKNIDKKIIWIINDDKQFILIHLLKEYWDDLFNILNIKDFYKNPVATISQKIDIISNEWIKSQANKLKKKIQNLQELNIEYSDPDSRIFYKWQDLDYISEEKIFQSKKQAEIFNYLMGQYFKWAEILSRSPAKLCISAKGFLENIIEKNDNVWFGEFWKKLIEANLISDLNIVISDDGAKFPRYEPSDHNVYIPIKRLIPIRHAEYEWRTVNVVSSIIKNWIEIELIKYTLHEIAHGITMPKLINNQHEWYQILGQIIQRNLDSMRSRPRTITGNLRKDLSKVRKLLMKDEEYWLSDLYEFIAEIYTDGKIQRKIKDIDNEATYNKIREDLMALVWADLLVDMKELQYSVYDNNARINVRNALNGI